MLQTPTAQQVSFDFPLAVMLQVKAAVSCLCRSCLVLLAELILFSLLLYSVHMSKKEAERLHCFFDLSAIHC